MYIAFSKRSKFWISGRDSVHLPEPAQLPDLLGDQAAEAAGQQASAAAAAAQRQRTCRRHR
jgi:hypothetical protein